MIGDTAFKEILCLLTVFVAGDGNVVDCSEFDTGVGQNLKFVSG